MNARMLMICSIIAYKVGQCGLIFKNVLLARLHDLTKFNLLIMT